jgi:hypothetical protein
MGRSFGVATPDNGLGAQWFQGAAAPSRRLGRAPISQKIDLRWVGTVDPGNLTAEACANDIPLFDLCGRRKHEKA